MTLRGQGSGWRNSLQGRLLLAVTVVLVAFLGATGAALDQAFRASAYEAAHEALKGQIFTLLAAADEDDQGVLRLPPALPEPRFSQPDSGLYGRVATDPGGEVWRSPSLLGRHIAWPVAGPPGQFRFQRLEMDGASLFVATLKVIWEDGKGTERGYDFSVAQAASAFQSGIESFRRSLWGWLGGLALGLLWLQVWIVGWGLSPLRRLARQVDGVQQGVAERVEGHYPRELQGLTEGLNRLIEHDRKRLERQRNALADLAHSLKTPLAVLRGLDCFAPRAADSLADQLGRMGEIVDYQLQRAAASGAGGAALSTPLAPLARKLAASLDKVYHDKGLSIHLDIEEDLRFPGDPGDLLELLGNLLDNACKWAVSEVRCQASQDPLGLVLRVDDDGPGIAAGRREEILRRGARLDSRPEGQGIGLAVVAELVAAYHARIEIQDSPLGGTRIWLFFAAAT